MYRSVIVSLVLVASYASMWTVSYAVLMQGDFRFYFSYLKLAWTHPGEIPAIIQGYSLLGMLGVFLVTVAVQAIMRRKK